MVTRQDWLLRFIAGTDGYDGFVDRIRLMKGMFLFQREHDAPPELNYAFRPYDYGPFTPELYQDIDGLLEAGLIGVSRDGQGYRVTQSGKSRLAGIDFQRDALDSLLSIRVEVCDLSFKNLLRRVYKAHPDSAARSVAKDVLA